MFNKPYDSPENQLEIEDAGIGCEAVFVLENGESTELDIPDDPDEAEDEDDAEDD